MPGSVCGRVLGSVQATDAALTDQLPRGRPPSSELLTELKVSCLRLITAVMSLDDFQEQELRIDDTVAPAAAPAQPAAAAPDANGHAAPQPSKENTPTPTGAPEGAAGAAGAGADGNAAADGGRGVSVGGGPPSAAPTPPGPEGGAGGAAAAAGAARGLGDGSIKRRLTLLLLK